MEEAFPVNINLSPLPLNGSSSDEIETLREAGVAHLPLHADNHLLPPLSHSRKTAAVPSLEELLDVIPLPRKQTRWITNVMSSTAMIGTETSPAMRVEDISAMKTVGSTSDISLASSFVEGTPPTHRNRLSRKRKKKEVSSNTFPDGQQALTRFYRQTKQGKVSLNAVEGNEEDYVKSVEIDALNTTNKNTIKETESSNTDSISDLSGTPRSVSTNRQSFLSKSREEACTISLQSGHETLIDLSGCDTDTVSSKSDVLCLYPSPDTISSDRVTITMVDYNTLERGRFLNDIIIDFQLKYLYQEKLASKEQNGIHIFSTMFYKRLTMDPVEGSKMDQMEKRSNLPTIEKRHSRVRGWTKNVQLLDKKLVLIPICEHSHWYMVVLVNPGGKQPCMLVMDSLGGEKAMAVDIIREYLEMEMKVKFGDINSEKLKELSGVRLKIPEQENCYDCGVFLIQYAEKILESPVIFYSSNIQPDRRNWFTREEIDAKRSYIARLIRQLASEQTHGVYPVFPHLVFSTSEQENNVPSLELEEPNHDYLFGLKTPPHPSKKTSTLPPDHQIPHKVDTTSPTLTCHKTFPLTPFNVSSSPHFSSLVQAELKRLSPVPPTFHHPRDRLSSQAPIFSSPAPATSRTRVRTDQRVFNKNWTSHKAEFRSNEPKLSFFTKKEFYKGKPYSEVLFDDFLQEESMHSEEDDMFSQLC